MEVGVSFVDSPHGEDAEGRELHRTCPECRRDCEPIPLETAEGMRISFICPLHGVHTVIDPFEEER
jgi:hypothetical protein